VPQSIRDKNLKCHRIIEPGIIRRPGNRGADPLKQGWIHSISIALGLAMTEIARNTIIGEDLHTYQSFFENAVEGMFRTTPDGRLIKVNPAYARMFGYSSPEEVTNGNLNVRTHAYANPDDRTSFQEIVKRSGFVHSFRFPALKKDGSLVSASLNARAVRDAEGTILCYEGTVEDITNLKLAEENLRRSEDDYRNVHDNAITGMFRSTPEGRYVRVNPALAAIHGFSSSEEMITTITNIGEQLYVDPADRRRYMELLDKEDVIRGFEARLYRKDRSKVWIRMNVRTIRKADGSVACYEGVVEDVTEKKRIESQLRQAQKTESIGTLAGGIAHDFNNLLTSLMGFASLIELKMKKTDPLYPYVQEILLAARKGADLTRSILALSRQQSLARAPMDMNQAIRSASRLFRMLITEDIELSISLTDESTMVMADRSQIDRILFNLVTNARDAMPRGGTLGIETATLDTNDPSDAAQGVGDKGKYVIIKISDTGTGFSDATKDSIFDPFFTTKDAGKGTGLGLAIVYGIVKQHTGHISVDSEPGRGTTFSIHLPAMPEETGDAHDEPPANITGSETILVAEDDESVRGYMDDALRTHGYRVVTAKDGREAVEKFRQFQPVDLVILDTVMPRMNGWQAYEEIRRVNPDVRVLFTSGYTKDIVLSKGLEEREFDFIPKPLALQDVLEKIRKTLDA